MAEIEEVSEWPAVQTLANFGFKPEYIGHDDLVLWKEGPANIFVWKDTGGRSLPPRQLTDPVRLDVETVGGDMVLFLSFDSVNDLLHSLGRRVGKSSR